MTEYCIECGEELPDDAKFCSKCGKEATLESKQDFEGDDSEGGGEWPYGKKKRRMRQGRKFFGNCPACGADAMWWRKSLSQSKRAECQECGALWVGTSEIGRNQYECVEGPEEFLGETKSRDVWKEIGPESNDESDNREAKPSKIIGDCPICGSAPGRGSYSDDEITCSDCSSRWERSGFPPKWELVESEGAPEYIGEVHSQGFWKNMGPDDDLEELAEDNREMFDSTAGRLPGIASENTTRRNALIGTGYLLGGGLIITAVFGGEGDGGEVEPSGDGEEPDDLTDLFNDLVDEHPGRYVLFLDVDEEYGFVDFVTTASTMDERAEEMATVVGVYAGAIESGVDLPVILAFGVESIQDDTELWSFTAEQEWMEEWIDGEIDGDEVMQRASETYEEYYPPE